MTAPERELTGCPFWCVEDQNAHGSLHESKVTGVRDGARRLFVGLAEDATNRAAEPEVTVHNGDELLVSVPAPVARSLAALLTSWADVAEGIRPA